MLPQDRRNWRSMSDGERNDGERNDGERNDGERSEEGPDHEDGVARSGLTGKLLVATPVLGDPNFTRTVILVLEHGHAGALGLILNNPMGVPVVEILDAWTDEAAQAPPAVMFSGGPVSPVAIIGLVRAPRPQPGHLGIDGWQPKGWHDVLGGIGTVDLSVPPEDQPELDGVRLFSGYSGWSADQLDEEIEDGAWFCLEAIEADLLTEQPERLWHDVLKRQGGQLALLATFPPHPSLN